MTTKTGSAVNAPVKEGAPLLERELPSGRKLVLSGRAFGERVEVTAPNGAVELTIDLRADGPVVKLDSARLELTSAEKVAVKCAEFEVRAEKAARVRSEGAVEVLSGENTRMLAGGDLRCNGERILLNCQRI